MVEDGSRHTPRGGDFTAPGECVSALRLRSLGAAVAVTTHASGDVIIVRYADDFVMGFQHRHEAERFLAELEGAIAEVRLGAAPGQNAADRVRTVRRTKSAAAWRREAGDVRLPGLHSHLWEEAADANVSGQAEDSEETHEGSFAVDSGNVAEATPHPGLSASDVAAPGGVGILSVSRHPRQHARAGGVPDSGDSYWLSTLRRRSQRHRLNWSRLVPS